MNNNICPICGGELEFDNTKQKYVCKKCMNEFSQEQLTNGVKVENKAAIDSKCPACGSQVTWNTETQKFVCNYCKNSYTLEELQKYNGNNTKEIEPQVDFNKLTENDKLDIYTCKNCGAQIICDNTTTSTFCIYCGSTAILKSRIEDGIMPTEIIPFKINKSSVKDAYKKLLDSKILAPKEFKDPKVIDKITGVYIPFWTFDITADGETNFKGTDISYYSDSIYNYTEYRDYIVSVMGHYDFHKIPEDASSRFDDNLMSSIEPFNYDDLVPYNHEYLSGFLSEKYDVPTTDGYKRAYDRVIGSCYDESEGCVYHGSSKRLGNTIEVKNSKCEYILLPVWMVNIKYKDSTYTFAMNGDTGKLVGNIPVDKTKAILLFILIFAICFIICFLITIGLGV